MDIPQYELLVDQLPYFVFLQNKNTTIHLSLNNIENNKDLFCFFLDMFCKGLALLGSECDDELRVEVNTLPPRVFESVVEKLMYMGVKTNIKHFECDEKDTSTTAQSVFENSMKSIKDAPDNGNLQDYVFCIQIGQSVHHISFELLRV